MKTNLKQIMYTLLFVFLAGLSCKKSKDESATGTFNFLIAAFAFNDSIGNYGLTNAYIRILNDKTVVYEGQLINKQSDFSEYTSLYDSIGVANKITLPEQYDAYKIQILKNGFSTYSRVFRKETLKQYFKSTDKGPLVVVLEKLITVLNFPFNNNSNDASGNGYNGKISGATLTTDRHGIVNSAYNFDGIKAYINVPSFGDVIPTSEISVSLWAKTAISKVAIAMSLGGEDSRFGISINYYHNGVI